MKNLKTIIILVLIVIIISLIYIIFSMKNNVIETQAIAKEQLGETTSDNAYITLEDHNSELKEKQQEIDNMQTNKLNKTLLGTLSVKYHNPSPSFTYDMKTITDNWASLTNDNFTTVFTSVGDEKWCGDYCCDGVTVSNPASISYNATTGIVTCSLKTARMNNNNKSSNAVTITAQFYVLYLI